MWTKSRSPPFVVTAIIINSFLDSNGVLRAGGRLKNADLSYDQKHPYILHKDDLVTLLIVRYYHKNHFLSGVKQLQYLLGLQYWITNVIYFIKRTIYKCLQRVWDINNCLSTTHGWYRFSPFKTSMKIFIYRHRFYRSNIHSENWQPGRFNSILVYRLGGRCQDYEISSSSCSW